MKCKLPRSAAIFFMTIFYMAPLLPPLDTETIYNPNYFFTVTYSEMDKLNARVPSSSLHRYLKMSMIFSSISAKSYIY